MSKPVTVETCAACGSDLIVERSKCKILCVDCGKVGYPKSVHYLGNSRNPRWVEVTANKRGYVKVKCPKCGRKFFASTRWGWAFCHAKYCQLVFSIETNLATANI